MLIYHQINVLTLSAASGESEPCAASFVVSATNPNIVVKNRKVIENDLRCIANKKRQLLQ